MAVQCAADSYSSRAPARARVPVFLEASDLDDHALARAVRFAALGSLALAWDLHCEGRVVDDLQEAMTQLQPLFDDPTRIHARALRALRILAARPEVD
jgi:dienelactone hydrolase